MKINEKIIKITIILNIPQILVVLINNKIIPKILVK